VSEADPVTAEDGLYASMVSMNRGFRRTGAGFFEAAALTAFYCMAVHRIGSESREGTGPDGS
jgi:hypothetical protein